MNLNELAKEISMISSEKVVQDLARYLLDWKENDNAALELKKSIERYLGNIWIEQNEDHQKIYGLWSTFRDNVISGISGMTMN